MVVASGEVCDAGDGGDLHLCMSCGDGFKDGGHSDGIGSDGAEKADLSGCFVAWAEGCEINAFTQSDVVFEGNAAGDLLEGGAVDVGHIGETGAKVLEVWARERILAGVVDVIGEHHQVARFKVAVDAARSVCKDQCVCAEFAQYADRKDDFVGRKAFVKMDAPTKESDFASAKFAEDELSGVSLDGSKWKAFDLFVKDAVGLLDFFGEIAESAAENDADLRGVVADLSDGSDGGIDLVQVGGGIERCGHGDLPSVVGSFAGCVARNARDTKR